MNHPQPRQQQGVVLFLALIALVVLTFAGMALLRTVDTGGIIAGNLAFRQAGVMATDSGVETARGWLLGQSASNLYLDQPNVTGGTGYYANWQDGFDPHTHNWDANAVKLTTGNATGYDTWYVIHRMCQKAGDYTADTTTNCIKANAASAQGDSKKAIGYGDFNKYGTATGSPYYRITTRTIGPRNTVSYVQVMLY
jgi:Tfp pilus assembly protein PilX